jgi:hypothetical protein
MWFLYHGIVPGATMPPVPLDSPPPGRRWRAMVGRHDFNDGVAQNDIFLLSLHGNEYKHLI